MKAAKVIKALELYVHKNSYVGYDPYDLRGHALISKLIRNKFTSLPTKVITLLFPLSLRKLLQIIPKRHPKAMALFASSYLQLYKKTGTEDYRTKAVEILEWLLNHRASGYQHYAWGPSFSYSGRDYLFPGTPTTVIICIVIQALLDGYQILDDERYLHAAESACRFIVEYIPHVVTPDGSICFSKAPNVEWYIHNSNIFVAAMLVKTGKLSMISSWENLARRAVDHTLAHQQPDGSWYYWSPPSDTRKWIDHYHTGFILRGLNDLLVDSNWNELYKPIKKGLDFYLSNMFTQHGKPKFTNQNTYPVDIHGCAEAIYCLCRLNRQFPHTKTTAQQVYKYTTSRMRDSSGYFYYRDYGWLRIKIPFMRWGQAWMMRALVEYLEVFPEDTGGNR